MTQTWHGGRENTNKQTHGLTSLCGSVKCGKLGSYRRLLEAINHSHSEQQRPGNAIIWISYGNLWVVVVWGGDKVILRFAWNPFRPKWKLWQDNDHGGARHSTVARSLECRRGERSWMEDQRGGWSVYRDKPIQRSDKPSRVVLLCSSLWPSIPNGIGDKFYGLIDSTDQPGDQLWRRNRFNVGTIVKQEIDRYTVKVKERETFNEIQVTIQLKLSE